MIAGRRRGGVPVDGSSGPTVHRTYRGAVGGARRHGRARQVVLPPRGDRGLRWHIALPGSYTRLRMILTTLELLTQGLFSISKLANNFGSGYE